MALEETSRLRRDLTAGGVTKPPALHSIVRLQMLVGNRAAQRILEIGDGRPQPAPVEAPTAARVPFPWIFAVAVGMLAGLLAAAISVGAELRPNLIAAVVAGSSIGAGVLSGFLKKGYRSHADSQADTRRK